MGQDHFEQIKPTSLELNIGTAQQAVDEPRRAPWLSGLIAIALTLVIGVAVIVLLPGLIKPDTQTPIPVQVASGSESGTGNGGSSVARKDSRETISPFEQAQRERERQAAKDALDALLELQFGLKDRGAEQWAEAEYAAAIDMAQAGDTLYRENDFNGARERYLAATAAMVSLTDSIPARLDAALAEGLAAIDALDSETATAAFKRALLIEPGRAEAEQGMARAASLDAVAAKLREGELLEQQGDEASALTAYQAALDIDPQFRPAREQLERLEAARQERQFGQRMSAGFAALAAGDASTARQEFDRALALRPTSAEARDGRQQAQFALSQNRINAHLADAAKAEQEERWSAASKAYAAALAIDPGLGQAKTGQRDADTRAALDASLQRLVANDSALLTATAVTAAEKLVRSASGLPSPGPRLRSQIDAAQAAINLAKTPVTITLASDGQTDVTLFRVGHLGLFESHQLSLLPGDYVAVGQRTGYRDVRVEFAVRPGTLTPPVTISCTRRI